MLFLCREQVHFDQHMLQAQIESCVSTTFLLEVQVICNKLKVGDISLASNCRCHLSVVAVPPLIVDSRVCGCIPPTGPVFFNQCAAVHNSTVRQCRA